MKMLEGTRFILFFFNDTFHSTPLLSSKDYFLLHSFIVEEVGSTCTDGIFKEIYRQSALLLIRERPGVLLSKYSTIIYHTGKEKGFSL